MQGDDEALVSGPDDRCHKGQPETPPEPLDMVSFRCCSSLTDLLCPDEVADRGLFGWNVTMDYHSWTSPLLPQVSELDGVAPSIASTTGLGLYRNVSRFLNLPIAFQSNDSVFVGG